MVTKYGCGYIAQFDLLRIYASATGCNYAFILCVGLVMCVTDIRGQSIKKPNFFF